MPDTAQLSANPNTDIWRKPPNVNVFNAPSNPLLQTLTSFATARLSLSFTPTTQYDQAGLLLLFHPPNSAPGPAEEATLKSRRWLKTGIELYNGAPRLSTVACDRWADWSVTPLPDAAAADPAGRVKATILVERSHDHHGPSLWVYAVDDAGRRESLREVCWVFALGEDGQADAGEWELEVAVMAARPNADAKEPLEAEFSDIEVVWK
ncbi:hypothetical protein jhhlp_006787 [Lomentospora prolificans]|uniref:Uncharacterized protein n=1 Tax=Lomentospora prolificans TaxID=41688 RepID=A0A2N3N2R3_9PEZI|nr:hypothetical protein jhhlp_006787 [Lomentospora prolificans]